MARRPTTRQVRPKKLPYHHQRFFPFAKKLEPLNRIAEIFEQNRIHLIARKYTSNGVLIELGSHKMKPGGLMATEENIQRLADHFGLKDLHLNDDGERRCIVTHDHKIVPPSPGLAHIFENPRARLEIPRSKGRVIGKFHDVAAFLDAKQRPVFAYYHYSRRASPPSQAAQHRWFVEFFNHPLSERIAKALSERNATFIGEKYLEWLKKTSKLPKK